LNTGGGVTFSGGEPLLQADFITEIAKLCKKDGISVGIQTAGNVPYEYFEKILPYTDFIMCDMKIFNDVMHQKYVGTSNKLILKNMERLSNENIKLIIRTPVISRINENDIEDICKYIKDFENLAYYELLKYHKLGLSKLENLNINSCIEFEPPTDEKLKELFFAAKKIIKNVKCIAIEEI
ncbi:MAG: radical SAM protein, partial [Oscillospiraceae bacterium]